MTWVAIDDRANTHAKTLASRLAVTGLWVCGLCWCNLHHTDGRIPAAALRALFPGDLESVADLRRYAAELVRTRRWELCAGYCGLGAAGSRACSERRGGPCGWLVHDYADHQGEALRSVYDDRRSYERDRKRAQREANKLRRIAQLSPRDSPGHDGGTRAGHVRDNREGPTRDTSASGSSAPSAVPTPRPGPARPDPDQRETAPAEPAARSLGLSSEAEKLHAEIRRHSAFEHVDRERLAEKLEGERMSSGRPLAWAIAAIGQCARRIEAGAYGESPPPAQRIALLLSFVQKAKAPDEGAKAETSPAAAYRPFSDSAPLPPPRKRAAPATGNVAQATAVLAGGSK